MIRAYQMFQVVIFHNILPYVLKKEMMKKLLPGRILWIGLLLVSSLYSQKREFNFYVVSENAERILNLSSVETFPCMGYSIKAFQLWNNDTLIIDIRGFIPPTPCYSGMDVAQEQIRLLGKKMKAFVVKFRWKGMVDVWKITARGTSFIATPLRTVFTSYAK